MKADFFLKLGDLLFVIQKVPFYHQVLLFDVPEH